MQFSKHGIYVVSRSICECEKKLVSDLLPFGKQEEDVKICYGKQLQNDCFFMELHAISLLAIDFYLAKQATSNHRSGVY